MIASINQPAICFLVLDVTRNTAPPSNQPNKRIDDENKIAIEPARTPGQQRADAVVVGPIHERVGRGYQQGCDQATRAA